MPSVPLSTRVRRVFGDPLESFIVNVPFAFAAPRVITGVVFDNVRGDDEDKVTVPDAAIDVAPAIAPVDVIPPALLTIPPVISAPPVVTVSRPPIV